MTGNTFSLLLNGFGWIAWRQTPAQHISSRLGTALNTPHSPQSCINAHTHARSTRSSQAVSYPSSILAQCCYATLLQCTGKGWVVISHLMGLDVVQHILPPTCHRLFSYSLVLVIQGLYLSLRSMRLKYKIADEIDGICQ